MVTLGHRRKQSLKISLELTAIRLRLPGTQWTNAAASIKTCCKSIRINNSQKSHLFEKLRKEAQASRTRLDAPPLRRSEHQFVDQMAGYRLAVSSLFAADLIAPPSSADIGSTALKGLPLQNSRVVRRHMVEHIRATSGGRTRQKPPHSLNTDKVHSSNNRIFRCSRRSGG